MKKLLFLLLLTSCITFNYTYECPCKEKLIELDPDPYWWYNPTPHIEPFFDYIEPSFNYIEDSVYWYPLGDTLIIDTSLWIKP